VERKRVTKYSDKQQFKEAKGSGTLYPYKEDIDKGYFYNYGTNGIHEEMVADGIRMEAYRKALINNVHSKVVLEVGTGTGCLAMIASGARATMVYAVEATDMANIAKKTINLNEEVRSRIKVVQGMIEEVDLGDLKVDLIFSEWMGYFLIYENMLNSVLIAKNRFLKPDGKVIPGKCSIFMSAYLEAANAEHSKNFIDEENKPISVAHADINKEHLICAGEKVFSIDLNTAKAFTNCFNHDFVLKAEKAGVIGGLVGWFEAELCEGNILSTSPLKDATHWHQQLFKFESKIEVEIG
jgi:predicted RNA methylase